jgi:hypothetical protein
MGYMDTNTTETTKCGFCWTNAVQCAKENAADLDGRNCWDYTDEEVSDAAESALCDMTCEACE